MEEFLNSSSPTTNNHFGNFGMSDASGVGISKQLPSRHHSHSYSGNAASCDKPPSRMQTENEHLRERVRSCERGVGKMYQMILHSRQKAKNPPTFNHARSASVSHQYSPSPSPVPESYHVSNGYGMEFDDVFSTVPQISIPELQTSIERLLSDWDSLLSQVDDLKQITEAAKRERVLAIDEKDQLLRETHSLRVAVESAQSLLGKMEEEREALRRQVRDLKDELVLLKRDNEKAREMRSLALEERSKMRMEFSELQHELRSFQTERDELYKKTMLQQTLLEEVLGEKERLEQDLGWLSSRNACDVSEGKYSFKEEPSESGAGKVLAQDMLEITLKRENLGMPWGFTFEGGRGTEFYHQDPSIVITGVANRTPAADTLRFGDRVVSFDNHDFRDVTKKEAAEAIRSCDLTTVSVEVGRTSANVKPAPEDVRIPGKKDFGFSYESRLFVTSADEDSPSAGLLLPGDEIIQVQGKSAFNMKPSTLKQLLKSCKDGVSLTIQRQPGINLTSLVSTRTRQSSSSGRLKRETHDTTSSSSLIALGGTRSVQSHRLSSDFVQSPGTPKSSISESSAGYHSLAHSIPPSDASSTLASGGGSSGGPDSKTGQMGPDMDQNRTGTSERRQVSRHLSDADSGALSGPSSHHRPGSVGGASSNGFSRCSYRSRPADYYSPRRATTSSGHAGRGGQHGHKTRSYSMSNYKSAPTIGFVSIPHSPSKTTPPAALTMPIPGGSNKAFSMSADNLDSEPCASAVASEPSRSTTQPESYHERPRPKEVIGRLAPPSSRSRGHLSVSTGNMQLQTHV